MVTHSGHLCPFWLFSALIVPPADRLLEVISSGSGLLLPQKAHRLPCSRPPQSVSTRYFISPGLRPRPPSARRGLGFQQETCSQPQKPTSQGLRPSLRCLTDVPAAQPPVHTHTHTHIVYKLIHCLNCTTHTSTHCINSLTHVHTLCKLYVTHHIHTHTYTHPINYTHTT